MASEVRYSVVKKMLEAKGYTFARTNGSHHIFTKPGVRPAVISVHRGKVKAGYVRDIEKMP